jgi:hypothetical protein
MSLAGVVVCPMNDAAFRVPVILPSERHLVSLSQAGYSRRDINVVGDEQGLTRAKFQNETLMPASVIVVRKNSLDHALAFDLKVAGVLFEGATEDPVAFGGMPALCARRLRRATENANPK